jgi:response regulator of citrate/malate metabolism
MFKVLIADDSYEDRELLRLEIQQALSSLETKITFYEASSISKAKELLRVNSIDLLTLDIQFDRLNEGIDALPVIFETHPTLNIIVISGKLDKNEVSEQLFRFTKDNVLKGKRWARHFDVLDKKDDKKDAIQRAYSFANNQKDTADNVRDLFILAESHLDRDDMKKCIDVYQKIQDLAPGDPESNENLKILKGPEIPEQVLQYISAGDNIVASLLFGHYLETRLKAYTRRLIGRAPHSLSDCIRDIEKARKISGDKKKVLNKLMRLRNRSIHQPSTISAIEVEAAFKKMKNLEGLSR